MPSTNEYTAIRLVLQQYIDASYTANVPLLKTVFHPEALMSGYLNDELDIGNTRARLLSSTSLDP